MGRFLSADTVQPNAPGSQGFNLYAYVANNPTSWIDPSGHTVDTMVVPSVLATAMATLISLARIPESWRFGNHARMANITFSVFVLILACFSFGPCKNETMDYQRTIDDRGSDSSHGKRTWSLPDLYDLPLDWPHQHELAGQPQCQLQL